MNNKLIMESWRKFVNEEVEAIAPLTEEELEQLEELFGKAGWRKEIEKWKNTDEENLDSFTKQGLRHLAVDAQGNALSPEGIARNLRAVLAQSYETKDPEAIAVANNMAKVADEEEPRLNLDSDPAVKKAIAAAPADDGAGVAGPWP